MKKYHIFKYNLKFECNWGTNFAQRFQSGFNSNSFRIVCFTKSCISIISQQFSLNWDTIHLGRCLRVSIELTLSMIYKHRSVLATSLRKWSMTTKHQCWCLVFIKWLVISCLFIKNIKFLTSLFSEKNKHRCLIFD